MDTFIIIVLVVVAVILLRSIRQVDEYERGVKFRFGKYKKIVEPGWRLVLPIIESMKKIDVRTKAVDVPEQDAITKDNVSIRINAVLYYSIFDAAKVIISVENYKFAVGQLAQTTMRNAVGAVTLDELLAQRDRISEEICKIIDEATDPWGIKVNRVELKNIIPPKDIQESMEKQMRAERDRRETILQAEGEKKAQILRAEGKKEAMVLEANAKKEAMIAEAEGQARAMERVYEAQAYGIKAINDANPSKAYLTMESFKSLEKVADGQATKLIIPSDIQNVASSIASISEVIKEDKKISE